MSGTVKKLNLLTKYPVKWSEYTVMNNFVQNFFDALGADRFSDGFKENYADGMIIMSSNTSFNKEWLYYIGASTKRKDEGCFAGRFGEGFKIASLVAYRDMGLEIRMESQDWIITVSEGEDIIGGINQKVLQYIITDRPYEDNTVLILSGATEKQYGVLKDAISKFYYIGNERFGKLIATGDGFGIFRANKAEKYSNGAVFINMQLRGTIRHPICFCNHKYEVSGDDRDRAMLPDYVLVDSVVKIVKEIDACAALEILEIFRPIWRTCRDTGWNKMNWESVLRELIDVIKQDPKVTEQFREKYGEKIVPEGRWQYRNQYERKIAHHWFRNSVYKNRTEVSGIFMRLGLESKYRLCLFSGGFEWCRNPDEFENRRIAVLERIAREFFDELICYENLPECKVLMNNSSTAGKAVSSSNYVSMKNVLGLKVQRNVLTVFILQSILDQGTLAEALPVYIHELLHQFGSDSSANFHKALFEMNKVLLCRSREIKKYETGWTKI